MVGKTLGHYEILEPLGKGGMGEVYRARDTTLKREVAIKVLPEELSADPDRLARLEREAHLLAALNHSNIATIHSLEEADGIRFLVLELVKGESLEERLSRGPMPVEEAVELCKQIAEALEAAHGEGIIHRDLKPANILISPKGKAKVLDFGLAKTVEAAPRETDMSHSPTLTMAGTQTGVILGTAPYMSPEQVRSKPLDKRADIWAFGCVLYEALTGRRAFDRETIADTLAAILEADPNWGALPAAAPPLVHALIKRCLRKDPDRRVHDIADARIEIEEALGAPEAGLPLGADGSVVPASVETTFGIPWTTGVPIVLATAVVAVLSTWWATRPAPPAPEPLRRFDIRLGEEGHFGTELAISPDGENLVFVMGEGAAQRLYRRRMNDTAITPLPGTEGAWRPFFSPDGEWVGFNVEESLKKVSLAGGAPFTLCDGCAHPGNEGSAGAWSPSGETIVFSGFMHAALWQIAAEDGGEPVILAEPDSEKGERAYFRPAFLPEGDAVLFEIRRGDLPNQTSDIAVLSLETKAVRVIAGDGADPLYAESGHVIYARGRELWSVTFDPQDLTSTGEPTLVLDGVSPVFGRRFAVSRDGTLVYAPGAPRESRQLVWVDRQGTTLQVLAERPTLGSPRLSPDGKRAVVRSSEDLWIMEVDAEQPTLTPFTTGGASFPVWTPDGLWVAFSSYRAGWADIYWKRSDGSTEASLLTTSETALAPQDFTSDGRSLLYTENRPPQRDIVLLSFDEESTSDVVTTPDEDTAAALSPDGKWLAYVSRRSGQHDVYVRPFPGPGGGQIVSSGGGVAPVWGPDGRELFYWRTPGLRVVTLQTEPTLAVMDQEVLFENAALIRSNWRLVHYDTVDGQRFLMVRRLEEADPNPRDPQIHVILNWFEELKRLVPTGR